MCNVDMPKPTVPAPPPDFTDEQMAMSRKIHNQNRKRMFAGLASTITNPGGAAGVQTGASTTKDF